MKECLVCKKPFPPKRKEQITCGTHCRQKMNGAKRKFGKTGKRKNWTYRKMMNEDGYLVIYARYHPFAEGRKMIAEHIAIMEMSIGRRLHNWECVHHKNEIKTDNRLENLELMSKSEHSSLHNKVAVQHRKRIGGRFA
jgi:hypothetical protein